MAKVPVTATFLTNGFSNAAGTSFNTGSINPTAGKLLVLVVASVGTDTAPNSITGAGCTFTNILTGSLESGWSGSTVWIACPAAPSAGAITIGYAASHSGATWSIAEFDCDANTGDNGASAVIRALQEGFSGSTNTDTTRTGSSGAFADPGNATVFINCRNHTAAVSQTPGAGMTQLSDTSGYLTADGRNFEIAFNWADVAVTSPQFTNNSAGEYGGSYFLELDAKDAVITVGFQPNAFQSDAFQVEYDEVMFSVLEGKDIASFNTTATTFVEFDVLEGSDLFHSEINVKTFVAFELTEGADIFAFGLDVKTYVTFVVTEGKDALDFYALTGAQFTFDLFEGPDVAKFRTLATWWDRGDAFYMYVPYEIQTITLTTDEYSYILVPGEYRIINLQSEWRRIDVDQERPSRREKP